MSSSSDLSGLPSLREGLPVDIDRVGQHVVLDALEFRNEVDTLDVVCHSHALLLEAVGSIHGGFDAVHLMSSEGYSLEGLLQTAVRAIVEEVVGIVKVEQIVVLRETSVE